MNLKYLQTICLVVIVFLISACTKSTPVETTVEISGTYTAEQFIALGPADEAIDILYYGGSLTMWLYSNGSYRAHTNVPDSLKCGYLKGEVDYTGTYAIRSDTVYFTSDRMLFDALLWDKTANKLHSLYFRWDGRVILHK